MRFFAVIFTILISIVASNFAISEKVSAQNASTTDTVYICPDGSTKYYDPADKKNCPKVVKGVTQEDITMWINWANSALGTFSRNNNILYKTDFATLANTVFNIYKNRVDVTPTQVAGYILTGIPEADLKTNEKIPLNLSGMYGLTTSATDRNMAAKAELALVNIIGNISAYETQLNQQAISNPNAEKDQLTYSTNLNNATLAAQKAVDKKIADEQASKCSFLPMNLGACIDSFFAWIITHTLLAIAGWLLWVTATVMNYAINVGILQFASWAPEALYPVWLVVRQITSLFVVFAGLWLGFMYIIDKGDQFKKYIPTVIIFALFVNFSYPLTRTVIDISNIISLNIYASTVGASTLEASTISVGADKTAGTLIMNKLGLLSIVDYATGDGKTTAGSLNSINSVGPALLAVLFILYAAWIFFIISALLVTRTAMLVFLIIASPLLFVDKVIPKLGEHATKLRGTFVEMLFVGPVFTIMLALTLKFLEVFQSGPLKNGGSISSIAAGGDGAITMFFNMLMMLIMLHIMFKVTKATSGKIGETVAGVASMAGGVAFGGVARAGFAGLGAAGRATLGRGAAAVRDGAWIQRNQSNMFGRAAHGITNSIATNSFDGRQLGFVQKNASKMNLGQGMGTGSKLGFEARADERDKDRVERLRGIGVHKKNIYTRNEKGELEITKKGSIIDTSEAVKLRSDYITSSAGISGGALFNATTQQKQDLEFKLQKADESAKKKTYTEEEKADRQLQALEALAAKNTAANISTNSGTPATSVTPPQAVTVAINNSVALPGKVQTPAPTVGSTGYPANPKAALTLETPEQTTTKVTVSQKEHVLDTVPF